MLPWSALFQQDASRYVLSRLTTLKIGLRLPSLKMRNLKGVEAISPWREKIERS